MRTRCIADTQANREYVNSILQYFPDRNYSTLKVLIGSWQTYNIGENEDRFPSVKELLDWQDKLEGNVNDNSTKSLYERLLDRILKNAPRDSQGRLLAPNGKPSNLTERQYAQVRTKAFKDWFGDWNSNVDLIFDFDKVDNSLVDIEEHNKPWKNNANKVNKTVRIYLKGQHEKGYFELVKDEEPRYYSIHLKTSTERTGSLTTSRGEKSIPSTREERKILWDQLIKLIPDGSIVSTWGELSDDGIYALNKIGRLGKFNKIGERQVSKKKSNEKINIPVWQKESNVSKVVDENGEPLVVYHGGSSAKIFNTKGGQFGAGIKKGDVGTYFTTSKSNAKSYEEIYTYKSGEKWIELADLAREGLLSDEEMKGIDEAWEIEKPSTRAFFLNIRNPKITNYEGTSEKGYTRKDSNTGDNDGQHIIISDASYDEYVAFNPNQIKSATDNVGTFDSSNDSILYQTDSKLNFLDEYNKLNKLSKTYKSLSAIGSNKKIKDFLKHNGISPEVSNLILKAIELNPSLRNLSPSGVFNSVVSLRQKDLLKVFHENYGKAINKELEALLLPILQKYNISIEERDMEKFGGALGAFDILNKVIYLANSDIRNATTFPEEFSHAFIELMGTPRNPKRSLPENQDFNFLMDSVENTALYKEVFEQYKDIYTTKDGQPDIYKIKKEAIGKALAAGLISNFESKQSEELSFWTKLKQWFQAILDKFKGVEYSSFENLIDKISKEILNGDTTRLDKVDASNYKLLDYAETLANQTKQDGGKAQQFLKYFSDLGNIITGSLSYRYQGTVYRSNLDSLHDIDMIVPQSVHNIDMSSSLVRGLLTWKNRENAVEWFSQQPYFKSIKAKYPKIRLGAVYNAGDFITVNAVYSENEELSSRFLRLSGGYADRLEHFSENERKQIYLFDFFLNNENQNTEYVTSPESYKLAKWDKSFVQKQFSMGRAKDIFDYQRWQRFKEFENVVDTSTDNIMYQMGSTQQNVDNTTNEFLWARTATNSYEVSSKGDKRFSALNAKFKEGTTIEGVDVSGMTIEDVYQKVIKKSGKGKVPAVDSILNIDNLHGYFEGGGSTLTNDYPMIPTSLEDKLKSYSFGNGKLSKDNLEDISYYIGYLPLWQEWAKQNPKLIEELREKSKGKILTDRFANTRVSQARALTDILNSGNNQIGSIITENSSKDVYNKTFGKFSNLTDKVESINSKEQQSQLKERPKETQAIMKANQTFSNPIVRRNRVEKIARLFSNKIYSLLNSEIEVLNNRIKNENDIETKRELIEEVKNISPVDILKVKGAGEIFNEVKSLFDKYVNYYNSKGPEGLVALEAKNALSKNPKLSYQKAMEIAKDLVSRKVSAYKDIIDNWDVLVTEVAAKLSETLGISMDIQGKTLIKPSEDDTNIGIEEDGITIVEQDEDSYRESYTVKIREVSNFSRLSVQVRQTINNIAKMDKEGNQILDDLGDTQYLNSSYVHSELIQALSTMTEAKDFMPTLYKLAKSKPWVTQIINELEKNPKLKSSFYRNYRKDTLNYWIQKPSINSDGTVTFKTIPINKSEGTAHYFDTWRLNYEYGNTLTKNSVYNSDGEILKDKAAKNLDTINSLLSRITSNSTREERRAFSTSTDTLDTIQDLLASIGINISNDVFISALTLNIDGYSKFPAETILNNLRTIFNTIKNDSKIIDRQQLDIINYFSSPVNTIANIFNNVEEDSTESNTRQGSKTMYSHVNPSYTTTLIKKLKGDNFRDFIMREYGEVEWFRKTLSSGEHIWRNQLIQDILEDEKVRDKLSHAVVIEHNGKEYADWSPLDSVLVLINQYYSDPSTISDSEGYAFYQLPMLADAQSAEFIKYKRFTKDFEGKVLDKLVTVVEQELDRISLVNKRAEASGITTIASLDKTNKSNGGAEFKFFPELNSLSFNGKSFIEALNSLELENERREFIKEELSKIMRNRFSDAMEDFREMGLLDKTTSLDLSKFKYFNYTSETKVENYLKEWFYNSTYAQSQIIQLLTTDLAYYPNLENFYKRAKQFHAPSERLNTLATWNVNGVEVPVAGYVKNPDGTEKLDENGEKIINEMERYITLKDTKDVSLSIKELEKALNGIARLSKYDKEIILGQYQEIVTADAQAWRTLSSLRKVLIFAGEWTEIEEEAYNNFMNDKWSAKDFVVMWNVKKPYLYTLVNQDSQLGDGKKIRNPIQNKNAEALLVTQAIFGTVLKSPKLKALNDFMEENGIDLVQFESAVKVGNQGVIDINDLSSYEEVYQHLREETLKPYYIQEVNYNDYGIQTATPQHSVDEVILEGTQIRRLMGSDANPSKDPNFRFTYNNIEWTVDQWFNYYNAINTSIIKDSFQSISDRFKSIKDISDFIISEIRTNPRWGNDLIEAFSLNSEGSFNIPLLDPSQTVRIQNLLNSILKNTVTKQKQEGATLIQVSAYGLLKEPTYEYGINPKTGESKLKYVECYIPCPSEELYRLLVDDKTHEININKKDKDGNYIVPRKYLEAIGYRVPTEDAYSMAPLRIIGFLPRALGSVIILPRDITKTAGSDFDVDKLYVLLHKLRTIDYDYERAQYDYNKVSKLSSLAKSLKDENSSSTSLDDILEALDTNSSFKEWFNNNKQNYKTTPKVQVISFKYNKKIDPNNKKDVYNYVSSRSKDERRSLKLDLMYSYLTNSNILEKFINPGGFLPQKRASRLISLLDNYNSDEINRYSLEHLKEASLEELEDIHSSLKGKLNPLVPTTWVTMHERNMAGAALIGIAANHNTSHAIMQRTNLESKIEFTINGKKLKRLNRILAPDNTYITRNIAGFLAAFVDNAKDPVAGDMHFNTLIADTAFALLRLGSSPMTTALIISQPVVRDIVKESQRSDISMNEAIQTVEDYYKILAKVTSVSERNDITDIQLMQDIADYSKVKTLSDTDNIGPSLWKSQLSFLQTFKKMVSLGQDLSSLTQATRSDTQNGAAGPTEADNIIAIERIESLLDKAGTDEISIEGVEEIIDFKKSESDIVEAQLPIQQAFFTYGVESTEELFKTILPYHNNTYRYLASYIKSLSPYGRVSSKTLNMLYNDFVSYYLSQFPEFSRYYTVTKKGKHGELEETQVPAREYYMYYFPIEFKNFLQSEEAKNYSLLSRMKVLNKTKYSSVPSIILTNLGKKVTPTIREQYMGEWRDLLFTSEYSDIMEKLFNYTMFRGFGFTPSGFSQYIPSIAKMNNSSYIKTLNDLLTIDLTPKEIRSGNALNNFIVQFVRNHLDSPGLVSDVTSSVTNELTDTNGNQVSDSTERFRISLNSNSKSELRKFSKPYYQAKDIEFKEFIKLTLNNKDLFFMLENAEYDESGQSSSATYRKITPLGKAGQYVEYDFDIAGADMTSFINGDHKSQLEDYIPQPKEKTSTPESSPKSAIQQMVDKINAKRQSENSKNLQKLDSLKDKKTDSYTNDNFCA